MNVLKIFQDFQTQEQAVEYLEKVRWRGKAVCPYCKSKKTASHASGDRKGHRWQCQDCSRAFAVTVGTIFHGTHIPLKEWFLLLALMLNAKKSASAYQIARDLGMRRPTVWSMMHRVRIAMANDPAQKKLLHGIVEADETYVGGKPRKGNRRDDDEGKPSGRGRATKKAEVIGMVERGGRVIARPAKKGEVSNKGLHKFITRHVDTETTLLMTDEFRAYNLIRSKMNSVSINHSVQYVDGQIHTNTIEGFWSLLKRAWYGSHHHYSRKYMALYVSEACYKYNKRREPDAFDGTLAMMVGA